MTIDPKSTPVGKMQAYLQGAVVPRPIAFASTINAAGEVNLSPFSFFNIFSSNPPILVFSPARRGRDNTTKHTLENILEVPEVVINIVSHAMVQQTSLASTEYPKGTNEFIKAGLTEVASEVVRPPRVGESKVSFECKVNQVIPLGDGGGAGNLVIAEVILMHIDEQVLDEGGGIDPNKLDAVARMGGDYYSRASGDSLFTIAKPLARKGIGVDQIPAPILKSEVLTGNDLGMLGNVETLPEQQAIDAYRSHPDVKEAQQKGEVSIHALAKRYLESGDVEAAWKILLSYYD